MDTNYHNVSYQTPINNSNKEEVTLNKDIQEDYKYNKTPAYEPTSNTTTSDINKNDDFKQSYYKYYILAIIFGMGLFLLALGDIIVMFQINYMNYFNFIDDLVVFVIFILCIFSPCNIIRINKYLKIITCIDISLGTIARLIGIITSNNSKKSSLYYILISLGIFFLKLVLLICFLAIVLSISDKYKNKYRIKNQN